MKKREPFTFSNLPLTDAERVAARAYVVSSRADIDRTTIRYVTREPSILERIDAAVDRLYARVAQAFA